MRLGSYLLTALGVIAPFGIGIIVFGFEAEGRASDRANQYGTVPYWLKLGLLAAALPLAVSLFTYARRLRAPNALKVMKRDRRLPILLLRAFQDDEAKISNAAPFGSWRHVASRLGFERAVSFEEMLYDQLSSCGPMIAIGRPREELPPLGASRFWVSSARWKQAVEELLNECHRVVMIMGRLQGREGLTWEVERILNPSTVAKAVLVMPPVGEGEARDRWEKYRNLTGNCLPLYQGGEIAAALGDSGTWTVARVAKQWGDHNRDETAYRRFSMSPRPQ